MPERRNPVVRAGALLRKGGVHTRSVSGQRQANRLSVDNAIDEWYEEIHQPPEEPPEDTLDASPDCKNKTARRKNAKQKGNKGQSDTAPFYFYGIIQMQPLSAPAHQNFHFDVFSLNACNITSSGSINCLSAGPSN